MAISKSVKSASGNSFVWFDQTREEATIAEWQVWFNGDSEEKDFVVSVDFFHKELLLQHLGEDSTRWEAYISHIKFEFLRRWKERSLSLCLEVKRWRQREVLSQHWSFYIAGHISVFRAFVQGMK